MSAARIVLAVPKIVKFWLMVKPVKRIRRWRNKRRARKGKPLLNLDEDVTMDGKKTYSGIAIALLGFVLGWLGVGGESEATQLVTHGSELVGLIIATYGRYAAKP